MSTPTAAAKPKRKRRWWVRLLRAAFFLVLLFVLLLSGALWWVYSKRVTLLNDALANVGPMRASVGELEVTRSGGLEVRDLTLTDRLTGAVVARVPQVSGQVNMNKLPPEEVRTLTLRDPAITLTAAMLETWRRMASTDITVPVAGAPAIPIPFGIRFEKVNIENARVRLEQTDGTRLEVLVNYKGEDIDVRPSGLVTGEQELTVEDGAVKAADGKELPFSLERLHLKGHVNEGIVVLNDVELDEPAVALTPELLALFGLDFSIAAAPPKDAAVGATPAGAATPPATTQPPSLVRGIHVKNARLRHGKVGVRGFATSNPSGLTLPDSQGQISYEASDIEWHAGAAPVLKSQRMELRDVKIEAPQDSGHLRFESATFAFDTDASGAQWIIDKLLLAKPDVRWTPQLRQLLTTPRHAAPALPPEAPPQAPVTPPPPAPPIAPPPPLLVTSLLLKQGSVTDASLSITDAEVMPFELHTKGSLMLANLLWDIKGPHSQSFQTLEVTEGRLVFPATQGQPGKKPWLELAHGEMVVKPDDWNERTRIARLALDRLVVRMRDGNTPWFDPPASDTFVGPPAPGTENIPPASPAPATPPLQTANREPRTENPWWKRIHAGQLSLNQGQVDMVLNLPKPVDMQAQVDITTQRMADGGSQHTVKVADFTAKLPTLSHNPFPVAQAKLIEGIVRLPEMWTLRRFDELHLTGASVDMSEAMLKLFEPDKPPAADNAPKPEQKPEELVLTAPAATPKSEVRNPKSQSPWQVGHFTIQQSAVTVSNLVPGMPPVKFGVALDVKDTPLMAEDLAEDVAPQRVELSDIKIPSPNGTARYVAELDSVFVNFSLAGLMRKEIDRIEIVSPTLFVGEDLFWYVDFYRRYAERGAHPAANAPHIAAVDDELEFEVARAVAEAEPPISQASWSVKRLQVHSGKLVIAPKGVPLKGIHTHFPFQIDSEVKRGTLVADLQIPEDTYELPDLNLQFQDMHGRVQFNLPIKQKDNNLTETFEVESVRWKKLRTGKAFLSVTYDKAGIYSKFGAEAYEGYIEGQINVYTDDSFHWDGWLSGSKVQTRDITRILSPTYFLMDGRVNLTLVAQGSKSELYQADLTFKNHTYGKFTIAGINGLINDLPKNWDPIKAQITKIGLETLRDFEYHRAEMKCRFYGREGNALLNFSGPTGSRNFDIKVYDHRWKVDDEKKAKVTVSGTVGKSE